MNEADDAITRGTGNIFADLGYADAEERQTKLRLTHAINGVVARRRLTQAAAAETLGVNRPKVSALANYKLDGFSAERLMTFLSGRRHQKEAEVAGCGADIGGGGLASRQHERCDVRGS